MIEIEHLKDLLREAEMHLGGYMGSRFKDVEDLRCRIRDALAD
jgi:hypothetical protein